jgi:hypothetical protein
MDETTAKPWALFKQSTGPEIVPINDSLAHYIGTRWKDLCPCLPSVEEVKPGVYMITHNAWDGRE